MPSRNFNKALQTIYKAHEAIVREAERLGEAAYALEAEALRAPPDYRALLQRAASLTRAAAKKVESAENAIDAAHDATAGMADM